MQANRFLLLMLLMPLLAGELPAQIKYEREYRLDMEEVPAPARDSLADSRPEGKIRWFGEESADGMSVEAKFRQNGNRYSIEFDTTGKVEDIEIQVKWQHLALSPKERMEACLSADFDRFRIDKVQLQWVADGAALFDLVRYGTDGFPVKPNFEVVLKGREEGETNWYEYLFDQDGRFVSRSKIVFRNIDNLEY